MDLWNGRGRTFGHKVHGLPFKEGGRLPETYNMFMRDVFAINFYGDHQLVVSEVDEITSALKNSNGRPVDPRNLFNPYIVNCVWPHVTGDTVDPNNMTNLKDIGLTTM